MKVRKLRRLCAAITCGIMILFLNACGGSKELQSPSDYELGGEQVVSFSTAVGEDNSGTLTEMQTPDTQKDTDTCLYTYEKLDTGGKTVQQYVETLTNEDVGFQVVDENGQVTDAPDYSAETGSVILAKPASQDGKILRLDISWSTSGCEVTLTRPDGEVSQPPTDPMSNDDAVQYLESLGPAVLGLSSSSMDSYKIYPMEGTAMVNGIRCLKLQVYALHPPESSNQIVGTYLLSGDKAHLYRLENGQVEELKIH